MTKVPIIFPNARRRCAAQSLIIVPTDLPAVMERSCRKWGRLSGFDHKLDVFCLDLFAKVSIF